MKKIKLLLLACSGVRVKNEELRSLGVTLPGFLERGRVIASLPSLGLLTLAAYCPKNWEVVYREVADFDLSTVNAEGFDLVAISALTAQIDFAYQIADELRSRGTPVVLGGLHVSGLPDEAAPHATSIIVGEGELAWVEFCKDFERGEVKDRYLASQYGHVSFAEAKVPRYDLLDMNRYNRITVQTQRGCPRKCNFCAASHTISNYKTKPVDLIVRDIKEISKYWPHPFIEFADDNTFLNRAWAKELMRAIEPLGIRWFTETDISVAEDDELLELISRAGCYQVLIGLESSSVGALDKADPYGWKQKQFRRYQAAIEKIQSYGISVNGCFILGWDHDDASVFERTEKFIEELGLAEVQLTVLTPFPNTVLYRELKVQGRLLQEKFWDACTLFDVNYQPKQMSPRELELGMQRLFKNVYNAQATAKRKAIFRDCVRTKRRMLNPRAFEKNIPQSLAV